MALNLTGPGSPTRKLDRMVYHENFEEFLRDAEKSVDKLPGMVEGHVKAKA